MENSWWVSTQREEDAQRHLELLQRRHGNYSSGSVIVVLVGVLVAIALVAALSGAGYVAVLALVGGLIPIVAVRMVVWFRFGRLGNQTRSAIADEVHLRRGGRDRRPRHGLPGHGHQVGDDAGRVQADATSREHLRGGTNSGFEFASDLRNRVDEHLGLDAFAHAVPSLPPPRPDEPVQIEIAVRVLSGYRDMAALLE